MIECSIVFIICFIEICDDVVVVYVICIVMLSFGVDGFGFVIYDFEVDYMIVVYVQLCCGYFVVELDSCVVGGVGVVLLQNGELDVCELCKMYFLLEVCGIGVGIVMMQCCLDVVCVYGFVCCYLEMFIGMDQVQVLYLCSGFKLLCVLMGGIGYFSCDCFFLLDLQKEVYYEY